MSPMNLRRLPAILLSLFLCACATPPGTGPMQASRSLLLISIDGAHPDYLARGDTPNLDRLARDGVRAEWMQPSYPSLTFPNHYTLVTGLRPDHHGIVHNTMRDTALGKFKLADRGAVGDGRWWGGEPLWVGVEKAGFATATLGWPGTEAAIHGIRPTRWHLFDAHRTLAERVDIVAQWLAEAPDTRPRLATLYFEHADSAAHAHGPGSAELRQSMRAIDAAIGELLDRLGRAGALQQLDIVVVSDHGMAEVPEGQVVATEDMADPAVADLVMSGQVVGFIPRHGRAADAERALLGRHARYQCWRKGELPARWHYGSHPRVPAIVCQMDKGWDAIPRAYLEKRPPGPRGSHGFDPVAPEMRAIFIASGPSFRNGVVLPGFTNLDVYPLLAHLLHVPAQPHEGTLRTLAPALRDPPPP